MIPIPGTPGMPTSNTQSELMRDRRIPAGLKVTTRLASSISSPPVLGLRPRRGFLFLMLNFPNPLSNKLLPAISDNLDIDKKVSTKLVDCNFVKLG